MVLKDLRLPSAGAQNKFGLVYPQDCEEFTKEFDPKSLLVEYPINGALQ